MVRSTLDSLGTPYVYINGHVTPIGLFQAIEENPTHVIVLDDLTSILKSDTARQILLAALGSSTGTGSREVRHVTAKGTRSVVFTGGVICIANSRLNERQEIFSAIRDRVSVICYDPTDDEIIEQYLPSLNLDQEVSLHKMQSWLRPTWFSRAEYLALGHR